MSKKTSTSALKSISKSTPLHRCASKTRHLDGRLRRFNQCLSNYVKNLPSWNIVLIRVRTYHTLIHSANWEIFKILHSWQTSSCWSGGNTTSSSCRTDGRMCTQNQFWIIIAACHCAKTASSLYLFMLHRRSNCYFGLLCAYALDSA